MTDGDLLRCLLALHASTPTPIAWHVAAIQPARVVIVLDSRDEASAMIIEAVAGQFGTVLATESTSETHDGHSLIGCLIRPPGDIDDTAGRLRAAYAIATEPDADDEETGPF